MAEANRRIDILQWEQEEIRRRLEEIREFEREQWEQEWEFIEIEEEQKKIIFERINERLNQLEQEFIRERINQREERFEIQERFLRQKYEHLKTLSNESDINASINEVSWLALPQLKSQLLFLSVEDKNLTLARIIMKMEDCYTLVTLNRQTSTIVIACQNEYEDVVQLLFSKPFYYQVESELKRWNLMQFDDLISEMNSKLLHKSIQNNKLGIVNILTNNGVTLINQDGVTALHLACEHNQLDIVKRLVQKGASVNAKTNVNGYTPLHLAVTTNATEIVEFLLNKRANVDAESTDNETPLYLACKNNCSGVGRVFMRRGANATIKTKFQGLTPLHCACKFEYFDVARMILVENINRVNVEDLINIADRLGVTPFHLICEKAPEDFIIYAMDRHGADLNKPNQINGQHPLHYACIRRNNKIVSAMMNRGSVIDSQDNEGNTALHIACREVNEEIIKTLLKFVPNKTLENRDGKTAEDLILDENLKFHVNETFNLPYYEIKRGPERGYCLIINVQKFAGNSAYNRNGSNVDRDRLKSTFEKLRYKVVICDDPKLKTIESEMQKLTRMLSKDHHDSVVVCLLSHGKQDFIYTSNGKKYYYRNCIIDALGPGNCPAMKLKPKIVIVQACRGTERDTGVTERDPGVTTDSVNVGSSRLMPTESDFLFCYSTVQDKVAWRDKITGSYFIQTLCKFIDMFHNEEEIGLIFTRVNALMSRKTMTDDGTDYAATCELVSRLTKVFMFG